MIRKNHVDSQEETKKTTKTNKEEDAIKVEAKLKKEVLNRTVFSTNSSKNLLKNHLEEYDDFKYTIVDKRKTVIDFKEEDDTIKEETKLKVEAWDICVSRN